MRVKLLSDAGEELLKRKKDIEKKTVKTLSREEAFNVYGALLPRI